MMRDAEKTVGNMIDKLKTAFIGSIAVSYTHLTLPTN